MCIDFTNKKEIKFFLKYLKLYLSSFSRRNAKYLYLNLIPDKPKTVVFSNGDYELLTTYTPNNLFFHIAEFKDSTFSNMFFSFLSLDSDKPYIVNIQGLLKLTKIKNLENFSIIYDDHKNMKLLINNTLTTLELNSTINPTDESSEEESSDEDTITRETADLSELMFVDDAPVLKFVTFLKEDIIGQEVNNFYALAIIDKLLSDFFESINNDDITTTINLIDRQLDTFYSHFIKISLTDVLNLNKNLSAIIIDGVDIPSAKECIKKIKDEPVSVNMLLKVSQNEIVTHMVKYEDENVVMYCYRPYTYVTIIKTKTEE